MFYLGLMHDAYCQREDWHPYELGICCSPAIGSSGIPVLRQFACRGVDGIAVDEAE